MFGNKKLSNGFVEGDYKGFSPFLKGMILITLIVYLSQGIIEKPYWNAICTFARGACLQFLILLVTFKAGVIFSKYLERKRGEQNKSYSYKFEDAYSKIEEYLLWSGTIIFSLWLLTRFFILRSLIFHWMDVVVLIPIGAFMFFAGRNYD